MVATPERRVWWLGGGGVRIQGHVDPVGGGGGVKKEGGLKGSIFQCFLLFYWHQKTFFSGWAG